MTWTGTGRDVAGFSKPAATTQAALKTCECLRRRRFGDHLANLYSSLGFVQAGVAAELLKSCGIVELTTAK